jgi:D-alanyl-D-alanine carboxypeptidase
MKALLLAAALLFPAAPAFAATQAEQIDQLFSTAAADGKFGGNVLVIRGGATIYEKSFGAADKARQISNSSASRFSIASVSKPFTAIAVLKLAQQGKLRLEGRLDTLFPELKGAAIAGVTIAQLLSHTSGIEEVVARHLDRPLIADDLKAAVLASKVGEFHYSNSGYMVLRLVMEKVSGQRYGQLLDRFIFRPAGMKNSGLLQTGKTPAGLSLSYKTVESEAPMVSAIPMEVFGGAGTLFSTSGDLVRFDRALRNGKLLRPAMLDVMSSGHTPSGNWGYGWARDQRNGKTWLSHQGDYNGYHAVLIRQAESRDLIVILSNLDTTSISALQKRILEILG